MATIFTAVNPLVVGPLDDIPEKKAFPVAAAQTWKKGTPVYINGGAVTIVTNGTIPVGQAADDIVTPTTGSDVWVNMWNIGTRLEMYVATRATGSTVACAATAAMIGVEYDLAVLGTGATLVAYMDTNSPTDKCFRVLDGAWLYEPERNNLDDSPGKVLVEVVKLA